MTNKIAKKPRHRTLEEALKELADAGISHKTLHLAGASYHFEQGGDPTSVPESHAAWLLTNPHYAFKRV